MASAEIASRVPQAVSLEEHRRGEHPFCDYEVDNASPALAAPLLRRLADPRNGLGKAIGQLGAQIDRWTATLTDHPYPLFPSELVRRRDEGWMVGYVVVHHGNFVEAVTLYRRMLINRWDRDRDDVGHDDDPEVTFRHFTEFLVEYLQAKYVLSPEGMETANKLKGWIANGVNKPTETFSFLHDFLPVRSSWDTKNKDELLYRFRTNRFGSNMAAATRTRSNGSEALVYNLATKAVEVDDARMTGRLLRLNIKTMTPVTVKSYPSEWNDHEMRSLEHGRAIQESEAYPTWRRPDSPEAPEQLATSHTASRKEMRKRQKAAKKEATKAANKEATKAGNKEATKTGNKEAAKADKTKNDQVFAGIRYQAHPRETVQPPNVLQWTPEQADICAVPILKLGQRIGRLDSSEKQIRSLSREYAGLMEADSKASFIKNLGVSAHHQEVYLGVEKPKATKGSEAEAEKRPKEGYKDFGQGLYTVTAKNLEGHVVSKGSYVISDDEDAQFQLSSSARQSKHKKLALKDTDAAYRYVLEHLKLQYFRAEAHQHFVNEQMPFPVAAAVRAVRTPQDGIATKLDAHGNYQLPEGATIPAVVRPFFEQLFMEFTKTHPDYLPFMGKPTVESFYQAVTMVKQWIILRGREALINLCPPTSNGVNYADRSRGDLLVPDANLDLAIVFAHAFIVMEPEQSFLDFVRSKKLVKFAGNLAAPHPIVVTFPGCSTLADQIMFLHHQGHYNTNGSSANVAATSNATRKDSSDEPTKVNAPGTIASMGMLTALTAPQSTTRSPKDAPKPDIAKITDVEKSDEELDQAVEPAAAHSLQRPTDATAQQPTSSQLGPASSPFNQTASPSLSGSNRLTTSGQGTAQSQPNRWAKYRLAASPISHGFRFAEAHRADQSLVKRVLSFAANKLPAEFTECKFGLGLPRDVGDETVCRVVCSNPMFADLMNDFVTELEAGGHLVRPELQGADSLPGIRSHGSDSIDEHLQKKQRRGESPFDSIWQPRRDAPLHSTTNVPGYGSGPTSNAEFEPLSPAPQHYPQVHGPQQYNTNIAGYEQGSFASSGFDPFRGTLEGAGFGLSTYDALQKHGSTNSPGYDMSSSTLIDYLKSDLTGKPATKNSGSSAVPNLGDFRLKAKSDSPKTTGTTNSPSADHADPESDDMEPMDERRRRWKALIALNVDWLNDAALEIWKEMSPLCLSPSRFRALELEFMAAFGHDIEGNEYTA